MKRKFIGERGATDTLQDRRTTSVQRTSIRYTIDEALDIFVKARDAKGMRPRTLGDITGYIIKIILYAA